AEFFANLQKQYDLARAKAPDPAVRTRAALQAVYPVREMIRRGWLGESDPALLELQIVRLFEAKSLSDVPKFGADAETPAFAAKRTHYDDEPAGQVAWLYRVRQLARQVKVQPYSADKLKRAIPILRQLVMDPEDTSRVPEILAECGVRFVLV